PSSLVHSLSPGALAGGLRLVSTAACSLEGVAIIGRGRLWDSMFRASASKFCPVLSFETAKDRSCLDTAGVEKPPTVLCPFPCPGTNSLCSLGLRFGDCIDGRSGLCFKRGGEFAHASSLSVKLCICDNVHT